jgi:hypothetical protein
MRGTNPSLYVCAALLVCWPAFAFAQLAPDPNAAPQSNAAPVAQTPGATADSGQAPAAATEQAPGTPADAAPDSQPALPPPGPPIANFQKLIPPDQLAFLKDYDGRMPKEVMRDKRFK